MAQIASPKAGMKAEGRQRGNSTLPEPAFPWVRARHGGVSGEGDLSQDPGLTLDSLCVDIRRKVRKTLRWRRLCMSTTSGAGATHSSNFRGT